MAQRPRIETNRNGALGDFEAFRPEKLSTDELVELSIRDMIREQEGLPPIPVERTSKRIADLDGGFSLVRYVFNGEEMILDMNRLASPGRMGEVLPVEYWKFTAVFGVLDAESKPVAVATVFCDKEPSIHRIHASRETPPATATVLAALRHLDVPPMWRSGTDAEISNRFDLGYDRESGEWNPREPVFAVSMRMERACFATRPTMRESIDVMLPVDPAHDIASADEDSAYWAKDFYRNEAFGHLPEGTRPGFSSWLCGKEPMLVKIVKPGLEDELARVMRPREEECDEDATHPAP